MALYVETTERDKIPGNKDWIFLETPDGDTRFVVAADAGRFLLPACVFTTLVARVVEALQAAS